MKSKNINKILIFTYRYMKKIVTSLMIINNVDYNIRFKVIN